MEYAAQTCRWATVLKIGWVLCTVIGLPNAVHRAAIFWNSVKPGALTMSGWMMSTLPLRIRSR